MVRRLLGLQLAVLAVAALGATSAAASVLYVGDSLGVGTAPYLRGSLNQAGFDVDVKTGRTSAEGVEVLGSMISPDHDVVIFDLGTNDDPAAPGVLGGDLAKARRIAGDRCLVVATLNRPPLKGVPIDDLNRVITSFAARSPTVSLVDWHAAVAADPSLLVDGVHATGDGYALRARLFADAISTCTAFPTSSGPLEQEDGSGLPPASAGSQGGGATGQPQPAGGGGLRIEALANAVARAVATGAEFG